MDFYDGELDFGLEKKVKPFSWQKAFPMVFKQGGFDAVIGNPPYGADLSQEERNHLNKLYSLGNTDTAALFSIFALTILRRGGLLGFILPKGLTYASNWEITREKLLNHLVSLVDCSKVWTEVKLEMSIIILCKDLNLESFSSFIRAGSNIIEVGIINKETSKKFNFFLNGVSNRELLIGEKLRTQKLRLNDFLSNRRGGMLQKFIDSNGEIFALGGKEVQRYGGRPNSTKKINKTNIDEVAKISRDSILVQNIVAHTGNPVPHVKIIATSSCSFNPDECVLLDTVNQLVNKSNFDTKVFLAIINSKLISWYVYRFVFANAIRTMHFDSTTTNKFPFPDLNQQNKFKKANSNKMVSLVDQLLQLNKDKQTASLQTKLDQIQSKIDYCEDKINKIVYELYGLTEEEIKIVEGE